MYFKFRNKKRGSLEIVRKSFLQVFHSWLILKNDWLPLLQRSDQNTCQSFEINSLSEIPSAVRLVNKSLNTASYWNCVICFIFNFENLLRFASPLAPPLKMEKIRFAHSRTWDHHGNEYITPRFNISWKPLPQTHVYSAEVNFGCAPCLFSHQSSYFPFYVYCTIIKGFFVLITLSKRSKMHFLPK